MKTSFSFSHSVWPMSIHFFHADVQHDPVSLTELWCWYTFHLCIFAALFLASWVTLLSLSSSIAVWGKGSGGHSRLTFTNTENAKRKSFILVLCG